MRDLQARQAILDWTAVFRRLSMNGFLHFAHDPGLSWAQMARLRWLELLLAALTGAQRAAVSHTLRC